MDFKEYRDEIPLNTVREMSRIFIDGADWKPIGRTGDAGEPLRHWAAYPPLEGEVKRLWNFLNESFVEDGFKLTPQRVIMNLYNHGDSSWLHVDSENKDDWTVIAFLNEHWDINWGGDFILVQREEILAAFRSTPGKVVLFRSNIHHGARPVSREAPFPRFGIAFQCKNDSNVSGLSKPKISALSSAL